MTWDPPDLTVLALLENSWKDYLSDPGTVTDLSDRALGQLSIDRGRQNELDKFQPGTCTVTLDNSDRMLDPDNPDGLVYRGDGKGLPLCPVQVSMSGGSSSVDDTVLFSGFLAPEGWPVVRDRGVGSTVTLQLVDLMWIFANAQLPDAFYPAALTLLQPDYWTRGNALLSVQGGGGAGYDDEIHPTEPWSLDAASGIYVMGDTSIIPGGNGGSEPSLYLQGGASVLQPAAIPSAVSDFTAFCWWKLPSSLGVDVPYYIMRSLGAGTEVEWEVKLYNSYLTFTLYTSGSPVASVTSPVPVPGTSADLLLVRKVGATIWIHTANDPPGTSSSSGVPTTVDAGTLTIGGNTTDGWIESPAYWNRALTPAEIGWLYVGIGPDDSFADRMQRMMELGGYEATADDIANTHWLGSDPTFWPFTKVPSTIGNALESATTDVDGAYWVTRAGHVRTRTSGALEDSLYASDYQTATANLSNETDSPDAGATPPKLPRLPVQKSGTRLDRVINYATATFPFKRTSTDVTPSFVVEVSDRDQASIDRYGKRVWKVDTGLKEWDQVAAIVGRRIARYANPPIEIGALTVDAWGSDEVCKWLVEEVELERAVIVTDVPNEEDSSGDPIGDTWVESFNIQGEHWRYDGAGSWTVDFDLAKNGAADP